jgi:hypothetical protein
MSLHRRQVLSAAAAALAVAPFSKLAWADPKPGSLKKGFGTPVDTEGKWLSRIRALRAKWLYSWSADIPEGLPSDVVFEPMVWGYYGDDTQPMLDKLKRLGEEKKIQHVLGFNEPDQFDQCNLTVEQAVEAWPKLMEIGVPLTSPSCVHPDRDWMKDFMKEVDAKKLRVDYVCVHSYGGPSAKGLLERLKNVHEMFGRPIWITEFGVGDWEAQTLEKNRHSPAATAKFMREVLPMLDEAKFVERYAWFSDKPSNPHLGNSALFDAEGKLTPLGEVYAEL